MGRAKPVMLDTRTFATQTEARTYFKTMLNRYQIGDRVSDADAADLNALLKRHTEYTDKIKGGIDHFDVDLPPDFSTKCFNIVHADGSKIDFSYGHCIDQIPR
jgi:hypothetical protein